MSTEPTDSELLKQYVRDRSDQVFKTLVERHISLVYGTALRRLGNTSQAEDIVQKTFSTLSRRAIWLVGHPCLSGWLHRTAVHLAQHIVRSEARRRQREQIAIALGTTVNSKNEITEELAPVLDEVLLELRAKDREALLLRFIGNKSLREVGTALGIREDAAQKRVAKALNVVANKFRRRGFRVAGAAAAGTLLQTFSAQAVPSGLALATTQAAAGAGATVSLGILTTTTLKLMSLNNVQTFGICLAIASVPLGHQWHSLTSSKEANASLTYQLGQYRKELAELDAQHAATEQRQTSLESQLQTLQGALANQPPMPKAQPDELFVWNEESDFVRIPRQLLNSVQFGSFVTRTNRFGQIVRSQTPPFNATGEVHSSLAAALGLSEMEHQQLNELSETAFGRLFEAIESHSQIEEQPFGDDGRAVTVTTEPFADYGAELQEWWRESVTQLLGKERADSYWNQSKRVFGETFNEFGTHSRTLQLIDRIGQPLNLMEGYQGRHSIGELDRFAGRIYPPQLQQHIDNWRAERAATQ